MNAAVIYEVTESIVKIARQTVRTSCDSFYCLQQFIHLFLFATISPVDFLCLFFKFCRDMVHIIWIISTVHEGVEIPVRITGNKNQQIGNNTTVPGRYWQSMLERVCFVLLLAQLVLQTASECPNACNGHGLCKGYDMCECYQNWIGSDCSLRLCQFGHAFVDTPLGLITTIVTYPLNLVTYSLTLQSFTDSISCFLQVIQMFLTVSPARPVLSYIIHKFIQMAFRNSSLI